MYDFLPRMLRIDGMRKQRESFGEAAKLLTGLTALLYLAFAMISAIAAAQGYYAPQYLLFPMKVVNFFWELL